MPRQTKAVIAKQLAERQVELYQAGETITLLMERFAELELALEDTGWLRMAANAEQEFSRDGLRKIVTLARLSFLKNPLINHAVLVQSNYVWGQGVNIHSSDDAVNGVIQSFLDDPRNKAEFTAHRARIEKEIGLQTDANLFFVLLTDPSDGTVVLRSIDFTEINDIVRNPEDSRTPWFYKRVWTQEAFDEASGTFTRKQRTDWYPDWRFTPSTRVGSIGGNSVHWDQPIYHIKTGGFGKMKFGVPPVYSALDWARATKDDLESYATIKQALARFAWKMTVQGGAKSISANKTKLATTLDFDNIDRNPPPVTGSTFLNTKDQVDLTPIKTAGMQPSPDEGRRMWLMVSAGTGIPETILSGDANVGNYATSRTLDRPTELQMRAEQMLWADVIVDLLTYVITKAKAKVNGPLNVKVLGERTEEFKPKTTEEINGHISKTVRFLKESSNVRAGGGLVDLSKPQANGDIVELHVDFPPILEHDPLPRVQAIVQAATLNGQPAVGTMPDKTLVRLLLVALGEDDVDEQLDALFGDSDTLPDIHMAADPAGPEPGGKSLPMGGRSRRAVGRQPASVGGSPDTNSNQTE